MESKSAKSTMGSFMSNLEYVTLQKVLLDEVEFLAMIDSHQAETMCCPLLARMACLLFGRGRVWDGLPPWGALQNTIMKIGVASLFIASTSWNCDIHKPCKIQIHVFGRFANVCHVHQQSIWCNVVALAPPHTCDHK